MVLAALRMSLGSAVAQCRGVVTAAEKPIVYRSSSTCRGDRPIKSFLDRRARTGEMDVRSCPAGVLLVTTIK
jgi:hypothetical protein